MRPVLGVAVDSGLAEVNPQFWRVPTSTEIHTKASLSRKSGKEGVA